MKKKLLVYLAVIVGCLFVGLTTFYMLKSYEYISVIASSGDESYINVQETETIQIIHTNPAETTTLTATISDESIISFNMATGIITGLKGGQATLTINSNNEDFGPFTFTFNVGDGTSAENPYYIKTADDLKAIGGIREYGSLSHEWGLDACYKLIRDIDLSGSNWNSIGSFTDDDITNDNLFSGQFFGDNKTIKGLTTTEDSECFGFFAGLSDLAIVDSIKFESPSISGNFNYVGIVSGVSMGATISKVEVTSATMSLAPGIYENYAYMMAGGIVGYCGVNYWEESGTALGGYGYTRTTITMCSFNGTIGTSTTAHTIALSTETDLSFGGIVGYNLGGTIFNNKSDITFDIPANLSDLSKSSATVTLNIGGTTGLVDVKNITSEVSIAPLVKNNLAVVTSANLTNKTGGVIGKLTTDVQSSGQQWIIGNYFYSSNNALTFGGSIFDNSTTKLTLTALKNNASYNGWDIGGIISIWLSEEGSAPEINFINGLAEDATYPEEVYTIHNATEFADYYQKMTSVATSYSQLLSKKFWLSQSYVLATNINLATAGIETWKPIGNEYTFMGTFDGNGKKIYFSGSELTEINFVNSLQNGVYQYKYGAIFAIIGTTAEVKNLTVENLHINYAEFAGGIAGINLGVITNCYVNEIIIENAIYAGFMAGFNEGTIQNTVESDEVVYSVTASTPGEGIYNLSISNDSATTYVGGAVGYNKGALKNIKIDGLFTIVGETTESDVIRLYGGVVGYNKGIIDGCSAIRGLLSDNSKVRIYMGGFCAVNDGSITNSYVGKAVSDESDSYIIYTTVITELNGGNQIAAGFVAHLGYTGSVDHCFANALVTGYYSAGFSADLLGTVTECYVKGEVTGEFIAGFACNLAFKSDSSKGGTVKDCYSIVKLTGNSSSSISAGLALFIRTPGRIENFFSFNTFAGEGGQYYETYTDTRDKLTHFFTSKIHPINSLGTITNIVINTGIEVNPKVEQNNAGDNSQVVVYLSNNDCLLGSGVYINTGFSVGPTTVWSIEEGQLPILTELNLDNIPQIIETVSPTPTPEVEE